MNFEDIDRCLTDLADQLVAREWYVTTAESCTGGGVAHAFTELPGSSHWFESGFITYSNRMKTAMLDVDSGVLESHGAVSEEVVRQMALGALIKSSANISVAISGIAGPDGGTPEKPVGTVWFAWAVDTNNGNDLSRNSHNGNYSQGLKQKDHIGHLSCHCELHQLEGDRKAVREQAIAVAIQGLIKQLSA